MPMDMEMDMSAISGPRTVSVELNSAGVMGKVVVGGVDVSRSVSRVELDAPPNELPQVTLTLYPYASHVVVDALVAVGVDVRTTAAEVAAMVRGLDPLGVQDAALSSQIIDGPAATVQAVLNVIADMIERMSDG